MDVSSALSIPVAIFKSLLTLTQTSYDNRERKDHLSKAEAEVLLLGTL